MSALALFDPDALPGGAADGPLRGPGDRPFTPAQAAAIRERSHSLVLSANAGSGKTSVLVERFARAVREDGVDPARILAITFTDKAAGELRERLRKRFAELGDRDAARKAEAASVSTIHGFCARLLRSHALAAGLDPQFTVLDEPQAAGLRQDAFAAALRAFLRGREGSEGLDLVAAYGTWRLEPMVLGIHDELRSRGQSDPSLPPRDVPPVPAGQRAELAAARAAFATELAAAAGSTRVDEARDRLERCARLLDDLDAGIVPWPGEIAALEIVCGNARALSTDTCERYVRAHEAFHRACADHHGASSIALIDELLRTYGDAYARLKRERGALDFDDLELLARDLLAGHPAIRRSWRERFALLMVDEFQDTNPRQLAVLRALEDDNLFSVGDEFQSIYGFRHADVEQFRALRDRLGAAGRALELPETFRALPELAAAVNAAFAPEFGAAYTPLRSVREPAADGEARVELLVTAARGWDDVDLGDTLPPTQAYRRAEARLVAQRVRELVDTGATRAGDVAVLVRASPAMPALERALQDVGLPTLATAGRGFWSREQVVDLMSYLVALSNPLDERALLATLGSPLVGVSPDGLAIAVAAAGAAQRDLWWTLRAAFVEAEPAEAMAGLDEDDHARLAAFARRFAPERARASRLAPAELLERAIVASGYDVWILGLVGGERRLANVHKLLRLAREFAAAEGDDVRAFVDHARTLEEAQRREPEAPVEDPDADAVKLMTMHAAKGLEFGTVVIADLGRHGHRSAPDLMVEGDRVGLRVVFLDGARATPALDFAALDELRLQRALGEERRVLYVACTRASDRLILSGVADGERWPGAGGGAPPIGWLGPALVPDVAERLTAATPERAVERVSHEAAGHTTDVRLVLSTPDTLGAALRDDMRAPGGEATGIAPLPPVAVPAPGPPDPPASIGALSYSALTAYGRCGMRFYAERVLRMPDRAAPPGAADAAAGPDTGLDARVRGVVVHALLEELDLAAPAAVDAARVAALAAGEGARPAGGDVEAVAALVAAFAASPTAARLAAAKRLRREHEFAFELAASHAAEGSGSGALLTGVVDAIAVEADGTWLVVDAKTDRTHGAGLEALVERDYAVQRGLYALAALRAGAPRAEVVHLFLERAGEPACAVYGPDDVSALEATLSKLVAELTAGRFPLTDRPHAGLCATCPARGALCPYPAELTLRSEPDPPVSPPR